MSVRSVRTVCALLGESYVKDYSVRNELEYLGVGRYAELLHVS